MHSRFHTPCPKTPAQAGQAWAALGEPEAAAAVLARAGEAAQALLPLCFERRGRGPQHQDAASLALRLHLERLGVALQLGQEVGAAWLIEVGCCRAVGGCWPRAPNHARRNCRCTCLLLAACPHPP